MVSELTLIPDPKVKRPLNLPVPITSKVWVGFVTPIPTVDAKYAVEPTPRVPAMSRVYAGSVVPMPTLPKPENV